MRFTDKINCFLFPPKCIGCGELLDLSKYSPLIPVLCPDCLKKWNFEKLEPCPCCSDFISSCRRLPKRLRRPGYIAHVKLSLYKPGDKTNIANKIIYSMKEHPEKRVYDFIADQLTVALCSTLKSLKADTEQLVFLNIPRKAAKINKYGADQSYELAKRIASAVGSDCPRKIIKRRFGGREQKKLSYLKRLENMRSALYPTDKCKTAVEGKIAVVVDDILTSGASVSAVADIALRSGAVGVVIVTVAETK